MLKDLVNIAINIKVPYRKSNFSTSWETISSSRTLLYRVSNHATKHHQCKVTVVYLLVIHHESLSFYNSFPYPTHTPFATTAEGHCKPEITFNNDNTGDLW